MQCDPNRCNNRGGTTWRWQSMAAVTLIGFLPLHSHPALAQAPQGRKWALLVGVQHHSQPQAGDLPFAVSDIQAIRSQLIKGAGFAPSHIVTLSTDAPATGPLYPSGNNLQKQFSALASKIGPADTFVFYFAGHSFRTPAGKFVLGTGDVDLTSISRLQTTGFPMTSIASAIRRIKAAQVVFFLDTCRNSGVETAGIIEEPLSPEFSEQAWSAATASPDGVRNAAVLFSCDYGQRSWDDPARRTGVFTRYLLEGLSGKATDTTTGSMTVNALSAYVANRMKKDWIPANPGRPQQAYLLAGRAMIGLASPASPSRAIQSPSAIAELKQNPSVRLQVNVNVPDAVITVDNLPTLQGAFTTELSESAEKTVQLKVTAEGFETYSRAVLLKRGEDRTLQVDLGKPGTTYTIPEEISAASKVAVATNSEIKSPAVPAIAPTADTGTPNAVAPAKPTPVEPKLPTPAASAETKTAQTDAVSNATIGKIPDEKTATAETKPATDITKAAAPAKTVATEIKTAEIKDVKAAPVETKAARSEPTAVPAVEVKATPVETKASPAAVKPTVETKAAAPDPKASPTDARPAATEAKAAALEPKSDLPAPKNTPARPALDPAKREAMQRFLTEAQRYAEKIGRDYQKAQAYAEIATAWSVSGQMEQAATAIQEARRITASIPFASQKARSFIELAAVHYRAGQIDEADAVLNEARAIAGRVQSQDARAQILALITATQAGADQIENAQRSVNDIKYAPWKAFALASIAAAQVKAGRPLEATPLFAEAGRIATGIENTATQSMAQSAVAVFQARAGLLLEARRMTDGITYLPWKTLALAAIAAGYARERKPEEALQSVNAILDVFEQDRAYAEIAQAQARAGQLAAARHTADGIHNVYWRTEALCAVAMAQARAGQAEEARLTADGINNSFLKARVYAGIAAILAGGDLPDEDLVSFASVN